MSRQIETDAAATKEYEDNKGGYAALPAGNYEFTVRKVEEKEAAKSGANASKRILNTELRITDDSPTGKGRVFFLRVPLFQKWAPSQKNPGGATAFLHFAFYEALGYDVAGGTLPDDKDLLGKRIAGKIVVKPADEYNSEPYNEVSSVWASKAKGTPAASAVAEDPWATQSGAPADTWAPDVADVAFAEGKVF